MTSITWEVLTKQEIAAVSNGCGPKGVSWIIPDLIFGCPCLSIESSVSNFVFESACDHFGVVYCLRSPSGRVYVGQTVDLAHRLDNYRRGHCRRQPKLACAIAKYGWTAFTVSVVAACSNQAELDTAERHWIARLASIQNGYNCTPGGLGGFGRRHRSASIRKMRVCKLGKKNSMWGQTHSPEARAKISATHLGRRLSLKEVERLRCLHTGKPKTPEHRRKISEAHCTFRYTITDPSGTVFETDNLKVFCRERGMGEWGFYEVVHGRKIAHHGWKIARVIK